MKNSAIVAIGVVSLIIIFCSMSAYMITRRNNKFYNVIFYIFQMVILVPFQSIMFPLYKELYTMHALSTLWGLIFTELGVYMGYYIFLYAGCLLYTSRCV